MREHFFIAKLNALIQVPGRQDQKQKLTFIGASAVFGAGVWRCEGAGLDRVEGLIRAREGSVRLRLRRGAGEPAAASDGLDEEDVDAGTFSAIFEDSSDEPSAADGPGAAPDGGALDTLVESILVADYAPPDA